MMVFITAGPESCVNSRIKFAKRKLSRSINQITWRSILKLIVLVLCFTTFGMLLINDENERKLTFNDSFNGIFKSKSIAVKEWVKNEQTNRNEGRKNKTLEKYHNKMFKTNNLKVSSWTGDVVNNQRIFFHETSGKSRLTFRQCCAIESAAKNNPTRPIYVFLSVDTVNSAKLQACINVLDNYSNIEIIFVDNEEYFRDSPLEEWYNKGEWRSSEYKVAHLSDFIRLVSLLRGGGLYLDIDYIIMKNLPEKKFTNFLVIEGAGGTLLNNGVMHFNSSHRLVKAWADFIAKNYDPEDYFFHGPTALSHIYDSLCREKDVGDRKRLCPDVKLMSYKFFCPIGAPFWELMFEDATDVTMGMVNKSFGIHLWNSLSAKKPILNGTKQLYALIAQENCPISVDSENAFSEQ